MNKETIKTKLYELWHGHPRLIEKEADIISETRFDPHYSYMSDSQIQELIKKRISKMYADYKKQIKKQQACKHEKWDCDTQIRTIECCECGKRAWIENYRNLYLLNK